MSLISVLTFSASVFAIDMDAFLKQLRSKTGVEMEIHGIDNKAVRWVATFRGKDFFDYQHFSIFSTNPKIRKQIQSLNRHDVVRVRGNIQHGERPMPHILISNLKIVKKYDQSTGTYPYPVELPKDILKLNELTVKVHAVHADGKMLVVDYRETTFPVLVNPTWRATAKALNRGDLIHIRFNIAKKPTWPVHLEISPSEGSIQVLEHMSALHDQFVEAEGAMVMFPKSPQVRFNVFALQKDIGFGLTREYTLMTEDSALFATLREQLQAKWDAFKELDAPQNGRNKWIQPQLRLRVKGRLNFISPEQANPQIMLKSLEDLTFL